MRRPLASFCALLPLLAMVSFAAPARAARAGFQLEALGSTSLLSGGSAFLQGHSVGDFYAPAPGYSFGATVGLNDHLVIGLRTGMFRDKKDLPRPLALAHWADFNGYNPFFARSSVRVERQLNSIPTLAILQFRAHLPGHFGFFDEVGAGVISFTEKVAYFRSSGDPMRLAGYQKNAALLFGGGLSWDYGNVASLVASADVLLVPSRDGAVWSGGDNPQFVNLALGLRYPKR